MIDGATPPSSDAAGEGTNPHTGAHAILPPADAQDSPQVTIVAEAKDEGEGTRSIAYEEMRLKWELPIDLLTGTLGMRAKCEKWLPREEKETEGQYRARVARAILYEAYKNALTHLSMRPFARPVSIKNLPPKLEILLTNTDRTGVNLTTWLQEVFFSAIHFGVTHVLVDYDRIAEGSNAEADLKARPAFTHIPAPSLIGWDPIDATDISQLNEIRIWEQATVKVGKYGQRKTNNIRIWTRTDWTLLEERTTKDHKKIYVKIDGGKNSLGEIPLRTLYLNRTGFLQGAPCMEALAWLNLAHFQSMSDQRNILRFARIGILYALGFTEDEIIKGINIGPTTFLASTNADAKVGYAEHTGQAIGAGRQDLVDLEARMEVMSLEPLFQTRSNSSATAVALDENKAQSLLQVWVDALQTLIKELFALGGKWKNSPLPADFSCDLFGDYTLSPRARDDILALLEAWVRGAITTEVFITEWRRRGIISETWDPKKLVKEVDDAREKAQAMGDNAQGGAGVSALGGTGTGVRQNLNDNNGGQSSRSKGSPNSAGSKVMAGTTGA